MNEDTAIIVDPSPKPTSDLTDVKVMSVPMQERKAQKSITVLLPNAFAAGSNMIAPINAPTFPEAALTPFNVDLQPGENVIEGSINVLQSADR